MNDLIDLNSPDVKRLVNSKLSTPLIPVPENIESNEQASSLMTERRESLDNNPFDNVFHETTKYVKKKGDPFEMMLQRALKYKSNKSIELKVQSVAFSDDFTPKRRKKFLKMNKTLDESLIKDKTNLTSGEKKEIVSLAASNINVCISNAAKEKDALFKECFYPISSTLKPCINLQRSLSQTDKTSSRTLQCPDRKSQSIIDTSTIVSQSDSTMSFLNKDFLESKQSQKSMFSDFSDVSSFARLNSVSLVSNLSSVSSSSIIKHATLDSNFIKISNEKINTTENSTEMKLIQCNLSELTERHTLNYAINRTTLNSKEETNQSNSIKGENNKQITNNKLIDIDAFVLESNLNKEHNKSTNSASSSLNSVFIDSSKVDKLILNEAKTLSRMFEELNLGIDSVSSTDDLISNDILWMSELMPAFEDESEDNLIELSVSPEKSVKNDKSNDLKQSSTNIDNAGEIFLKEIESEFTDCVSTYAKQTIVTTLLLDLKKLMKAEDNPEVSKLIDNLESALDVKYKNNTELSASLSNELRTSERSDDKLDNTERSDKTNVCINESLEENMKVSCEEKICDNESSLPHESHKSGDTSQATTVSSNNSLTRVLPCNNNEECLNIRTSSEAALGSFTKDKDNQPDEKLAVELLVNLGKLLHGQAEDATILRLLKNIGKALNFASNHYKIESESQTDDKWCDNRRISLFETSESEHNVLLSSATEAACEQSFNSKSQSLEKTSQRSISAIHSSNADTSNTQVNAKHKSIFELKNQKRFSNNPGLGNMANKKFSSSRIFNTKIAETAEFNNKNKKSLAIIDVKNKLKKKSDIISKSGPMKAMHSADAMQKKISHGKQTASSSKVTTPPKSNAAASFGSKIISSTPNSMTSPDNQKDRTSKIQFKTKRNFSCDISPVFTRKEGSPKRSIQPPLTKICTPKRQRANSSGIPKYCTPPKKLNSSLDMGHHQQSPQYLNKSLSSYQRYSPIRPNNVEKCLQSPLKQSNKSFTKVKPFKLISKLKEITTSDLTEKENYSE